MKKHVLILMSDTGGGHRAVAEAIQAALYQRYGHEVVEVTLLDVFRRSTFPMTIMPELYPKIIQHSQWLWGTGYQLLNTPERAKLLAKLIYHRNEKRLKEIAHDYPADVIVSVHSVLTQPALWAWRAAARSSPFLTVITNLISTHPIGYHPDLDWTMLPTPQALEQALAYGANPQAVEITGLPAHPDFMTGIKEKAQARESLGWAKDKKTILILAGGEGMGRIYEFAMAINQAQLDIQLVIVAGRNQALKDRLEAVNWHQLTRIYPFVTNMPEFMSAADILLTKAGPSSITEAALVGLPMILMSAIAGQETANIDYVLDHGAGAWCPQAANAVQTIKMWLNEEKLLAEISKNARQLANPDAVWTIAGRVMYWANQQTST